jgi:nickel-type superoxide dismutase maturation protease
MGTRFKVDNFPILPKANWREYWLWLRRQRRVFQVVEVSMQPTLQPGDFVLAIVKDTVSCQPGDIVIARHPFKQELLLIKRVQAVFYDGGCYLTSDNGADLTAQDSRSLGIFGADCILGRVTSLVS